MMEDVNALERAKLGVTNASQTSESQFDRIPVELMARVFLFTISPEVKPRRPFDPPIDDLFGFDPEHLWHGRRGKMSPLLLRAVCRRWRDIASSTPQLWAKLWPQFEHPFNGGHEHNLLEEWLKRSESYLLSLFITYPLYQRTWYFDGRVTVRYPVHSLDIATTSIFNSLSSIVHRCRVICIIMRRDKQFSRILDSLANDAPFLEELQIEGWHDNPIDLRACPRLQALSNTSSIPYHRFLFAEIHAHTLRYLRLSGLSKELYEILSRFPCIIECSFEVIPRASAGSIIASTIPTASDRITQPLDLCNLESLDVTFRPSVPSSAILWELINLRSLRVFRLEVYGNFNNVHGTQGETLLPDWSSLRSMLRRSRPPLEHLKLDINAIQPELLEVLSWFPALKIVNLSFHGHHLESNHLFWRALYARYNNEEFDDTSVLLPHIEYLNVRITTLNELPEIVAMILARFPHAGHATEHGISGETKLRTLRQLVLEHAEQAESDILRTSCIQQCVQAGLRVGVGTARAWYNLVVETAVAAT